ncbi:MAG: bifunctional folylpolyglutamate synthase/dihydrofolate synthase [Candidatus Cryptobacteroides sp.]
MQYEELIEDIFRRHPSVQNSGFKSGAYKSGIEAMSRFDSILSNPWKAYPCIHVAGTNGKGSVSSLLAANLASNHHFKVGLFTSPHLLDFRERIKIVDGRGEAHFELIDKDSVMEFLTRYSEEINSLSFFEICTGMALWWFRQIGIGAAVVEVGLGGRLDSTNVIEGELAVITSIGLDHCELLGNSRRQIAFEKAGIFKKGKKALVWGHDPECEPVFVDCAKKAGAELFYADELIETPPEWDLDLKGEYQKQNLRTALATLEILKENPDRHALSKCAKISGLRGRWEVLNDKPLTICDIGHNPAALRYNFSQLESYHKKIHIVYGIMADKALEDIAPLMPKQADYYLCAPAGNRAMKVPELYERLHKARPELKLHPIGSVKEALNEAREKAGEDELIYIGGSTFVVAEALKE